ncbi:MAG: hypothetical protein FWC87_00185 [Acidimicrobiaceae bacterium]|nr:hypothetical protein [Acidimicrobiaceae bacterium]
MTLEKDKFKEQFRDAVMHEVPEGEPDFRIIAWYERGGINFDLRTQDCGAPHLLTAAETLWDAAERLRSARVYDQQRGAAKAREVALGGQTLRVEADDVLLLLEREGTHWVLDAYSCATPAAEHLGWVATVLREIVREEARQLVRQARQEAERRTIQNRV